jgi:sulfoxide reductase heme-binding subunit YedZ
MAGRARKQPYAWLKPGVAIGALVPLAVSAVRAARGTLGANPIASALDQSGLLALIFLVASLAPTPLKRACGWTWPLRIRRQLGLFAFFYATLHLSVYVGLDRLGALGTLREDLLERPFIAVGFTAWLLLVPLAITSTAKMIKRLGFARWQRLHRLSYLAALLAVLHFVWRVKKDVSEPALYGLLLALLLGARLASWRHARQAPPPAQ